MVGSRRSSHFLVHGAPVSHLFDLASHPDCVEAVVGRRSPCTTWRRDPTAPTTPLTGHPVRLRREIIVHRSPTLFERAFRVPPNVVEVEQHAFWDDGRVRMCSAFDVHGFSVRMEAVIGAGDVIVSWIVEEANRGVWGWRRARVERAVWGHVQKFANYMKDNAPLL